MQRALGDVTLECIKGDITRQDDIAVIVNAANTQLAGGGGVDGAIHRAAGPRLVEASRAQAPIETGQAVITPAFDLPNDWVVHCAGPVYSSDSNVAEALAACYRRAFELAEDKSATSIAFPAISAGVYGYPLGEAAVIAMESVGEAARSAASVSTVRFVLFSDEAYEAFAEALSILT